MLPGSSEVADRRHGYGVSYPERMSSLFVSGRAVAPLAVAASARTRLRGLLGRRRFTGALLLRPAAAVHTVGMWFAIDVAHVDAVGRVLATTTMPRNRFGTRAAGASQVVEAPAGSFERWGVRPGVLLGWGDDAQPEAGTG